MTQFPRVGLRRSAMLIAAAMLAGTVAWGQELRPVARPATLAAAAAQTAVQTPDPATARAADAAADAAPDAAADAAALAPMAEETTTAAPGTAQVIAVAISAGPQTGPILGPETNLPLPRFVSLKSREGNARRGPSLSHRVDWVFVREDMPLQITAEFGHWRQVIDRDGLGGWVHYSLLSGARTVIVDHDMQPIFARPDESAPQNALLQAGVIARLEDCTPDWCRISAGGYRGWAPKSALWGVAADELRD